MGAGADGTWEDPLATGAMGGVRSWELKDAADCMIMGRHGFARGQGAFSFISKLKWSVQSCTELLSHHGPAQSDLQGKFLQLHTTSQR